MIVEKISLALYIYSIWKINPKSKHRAEKFEVFKGIYDRLFHFPRCGEWT